MTNSSGFNTKIRNILTNPKFIVSAIIGSVVLMVILGGIGFLVGLAVALLTLWAVHWDWSYFGITRINWGKTLLSAMGYTLLIIVLTDIILTPIVEHFTNVAHDYSGFQFLKGNLQKLIIYFLFMWVVAGFGEEFFYRGYMMKRLAELFGGTDSGWVAGAVLSSLAFGLVHFYQGISGVITTGFVGVLLAYIFYKNRNNLVVCMLTHGIYDMFGLTMIYLDKDTMITEGVQRILFSAMY